MRRIAERLRRSSLAQNAFALYGAHLTGLLLPLIAIPFLARVLRPEAWGAVVFAQSFAAVLTLVLEYGFYLSATREIARRRDDRDHIARIVADVQAAKLILLGVVTLVALAAYLTVPIFREHPGHLFWAWAIAAAQGFSAYWYYQGVERMKLPALTEAFSKALAIVFLFLLVRGPGDGALVLAIYATAALAWAGVTNLLIYREVSFRGMGIRPGVRMLRETARLFVFRAASGSYVTANSFILGAMAGPQVVAFFGGAERVIRGAINLIGPATQAIYPRISNLVLSDRDGASRLLGLSLLLVGSLGLGMGALAALTAPFLVNVLLGPGYEPAVAVLRALSVLPPIIALSTVLGLQWALPMGLDRPYFYLVVSGAALNVGLAIVLVPRFGALGMAGAVIAAECLVAGGLLVLAWRHGRELWGDALRGLLRLASPRSVPVRRREEVGVARGR
jgi:polysaccharide transporter, PST family